MPALACLMPRFGMLLRCDVGRVFRRVGHVKGRAERGQAGVGIGTRKEGRLGLTFEDHLIALRRQTLRAAGGGASQLHPSPLP